MTGFLAFKSVVDPSDCDFLGHMNVSKYFSACSDAVFALQAAMGLTAEDMRSGRRLSFAVVHAESDFLAEVSAGEAIHMESEVTAIGEKSMTFRHALKRSFDDKIVFCTVFKCVLLDLTARRAAVIPKDIVNSAKAWLAKE
ncbi:acyl-CoA thioesterase [Falsiruegeria mediterranea]|jgi:acyl-CoA thioester hydrolase|uniref:1,4-dihydroxy-2-naphthoyl-CoA hydrolase n=1 Tax=Falsiruegeria mediterranea M17 TaxID=1200281 RepID=A0A2R8C4H8_9RHOB|nr:acyl-CoA thioesterase [Falsiruegeria mediterranea]SPJ27243.1 1,4-dihydroxy-2-naphthoyl-CoA hydrolase [Falsiruegeria mediterranea M17]